MSAVSDRKFVDTFMVVLGILVVISVAIYALSSFIAGRTQEVHVREDAAFQQRIEERIEPVGQVAVAGQDNSALRDPGGAVPSIADAPGPAPEPAVAVLDGEGVYNAACTACHGPGIAGAPKTGDATAWAPRIDKGMDTLVQHAIEGFQGDAGYMPPRGGYSNLSDEQVRDAVQYMVDAVGS